MLGCCGIHICTVGILQSWSGWGEWSGSVGPCSEKVYRSRRRSCPHVTNPDGYPVTSCCDSSSEDVQNLCCDSKYTCFKCCIELACLRSTRSACPTFSSHLYCSPSECIVHEFCIDSTMHACQYENGPKNYHVHWMNEHSQQ